MDQQDLLDVNIYKIISKCFINKKQPNKSEIFVVYTDGTRESIWTFDPMRYGFSHYEFIGKSKIEAVFYCDRKEPRSVQLF